MVRASAADGPSDYLFDERVGAAIGVAGAIGIAWSHRTLTWVEISGLLLLLPAAGALIPLGWRFTTPWTSPRHYFERWMRAAAPVVLVLAVLGVLLQLLWPTRWPHWWHWPTVGLVSAMAEPTRHARSLSISDWIRRLRTTRGRRKFVLWAVFWLLAGFSIALAVELS